MNTPKTSNIAWIKTPPVKHLDQNISIGHNDTNLACNFSDPSPQPDIRRKRTKLDDGIVYNEPVNESLARFMKFRLIESKMVGQDKIIRVLDEECDREKQFILKDSWSDFDCSNGSILHVSHIDLKADSLTFDNNVGIIVVDPDRLISCTLLADSFECSRKTVLQLKFRKLDNFSFVTTKGSLLHKLFQGALNRKNCSAEYLEKEVKNLLQQSTIELFAAGTNEETCAEELYCEIPKIQDFFARYFIPRNQINCAKNQETGKYRKSGDSFQVEDVLAIEERLWSPTFGLKGNVDATLSVRKRGSDRGILFPFELKTGMRTSTSHLTQTKLYTMLLHDKYSEHNVQAGILNYLTNNNASIIELAYHEKIGLIQGRNRIVNFLGDSSNGELPNAIEYSNICKRCSYADICYLYSRAVEETKIDLQTPLNISEDLDDSHFNFIKRWIKAIDYEEMKQNSSKTNIWSQSVEKRIKLGSCLSNLYISSDCKENVDNISIQSRFEYVLKSKEIVLEENEFSEGDPIVLTCEDSIHPVASGYLQYFSNDGVIVNLDRTLSTKKTYTMDKDSFSSGMGLVRNNLFELFKQENALLRGLLVDLKPPSFFPRTSFKHIEQLNSSQALAVDRALTAKNYCILTGFPGTGKTTTLVHLILKLLQKGFSILLTSHTHSAVDNILLKLKKLGIDFLRLGSLSKIHPDIRDTMLDQKRNLKCVSDFEAFVNDKRLFATTALGIGNPILSKKRFDYCIVDEASQMALPICIGPLLFAQKFVLVGDLYQLPPIFGKVGSSDVEPSLFKLLSQSNPHSVSILNEQYRMNMDIMYLANCMIYEHRLVCGNVEVANAKLATNHKWEMEIHRGKKCNDCWLRQVLDPEKSVIHINTDAIDFFEVKQGPFLTNPKEADLIELICRALSHAGVSEQDIGVTSPYRNQQRLLVKKLAKLKGIEVLTVDKSQGRDKQCLIISLTRSNSQRNAGDLLKDWRRLNVSITRAQVKLIIIGSKETISSSNVFKNFFEIMEQKNWILNLKSTGDHALDADIDK